MLSVVYPRCIHGRGERGTQSNRIVSTATQHARGRNPGRGGWPLDCYARRRANWEGGWEGAWQAFFPRGHHCWPPLTRTSGPLRVVLGSGPVTAGAEVEAGCNLQQVQRNGGKNVIRDH